MKLGYTNQLMFEMLPGYHTQNFVSEIYRVRESADPGALDAQFDWATSYHSPASGRQFKKEMCRVIVENSITRSMTDKGCSFCLTSLIP